MSKIRMSQEIEKLITHDVFDTNHPAGMEKGIFRPEYGKALNFTFEMFQVMAILRRKDGINQQEIADRVQKNKVSLTPYAPTKPQKFKA